MWEYQMISIGAQLLFNMKRVTMNNKWSLLWTCLVLWRNIVSLLVVIHSFIFVAYNYY